MGVIRGVAVGSEPNTVVVCKEFPGAVMARMKVQLPAVLGILGADKPPRYVPVSRIRAAMKSTQFEESAGRGLSGASGVGLQAIPARLGEPGRNARRLGNRSGQSACRYSRRERIDEMSAKNVLVLAEIQREALSGATLELLSAARALAAATGGQVLVLVLSATAPRRQRHWRSRPNHCRRRSAIGRLFAGTLSGRPAGSDFQRAAAGRALRPPRRSVGTLAPTAFRAARRAAGDRLQGDSR